MANALKNKLSSFKDTLSSFRQPKMFYLFLLGISSGLPFALTLGTLQTWMSDPAVNISLKTIGLFAFLRLPFSLKFLWAPMMDRYVPPFLDRRRGWAVITQILIAISLVAVSFTNPLTQTIQLMIIVLFCNFFGASQDIVLDAYRREVLKEEELGIGSGVFVDGYLIAFRFISGAGAILLSTMIPWSQVYLIMAAIMLLMVFVTFKAPAVNADRSLAPRNLLAAYWEPLKEYFSRNGALTILTFIILYKIGDNMASTMTIPFILKNGYSKEEYVAVVKVWGLIATLIGGIAGGLFVHKLGTNRALWIMGFLQAFSTAAFALLNGGDKSIPLLIGVVGFENLTAGMGTSAYAAFMGAMTNIRFTASQYALLSSLMAIPGVIFSSQTGTFAEAYGFSEFFIFCALIAAPGMFLIPFLKNEPTHPILKSFKYTIIFATVIGGIYAISLSTKDLLLLFFPK